MATARPLHGLTVTAPGVLEWVEGPTPSAEPHGVVVEPLAVARCDLDPAIATLGLFPAPIAVGHELAARVVEVGHDVDRWRAGDEVVVPFQPSCGSCSPCRRRHFASCSSFRARVGAAFGFGEAGGGHGGALADRLAVPHADHLLVPLPDGVAPTTACTVPDNLTDAFRAVGPQLAAAPGADVLVVGGLGASIGLYAVVLAMALGASEVRYVDDDPARVAIAASLGAEATYVQAWPRHVERAAVVVDNTGTPDGILCAIRSTERSGTLTSVGIQFAALTELPMLSMYTRGITLQVSRADSRRHLPEVLGLVADGRVDPLVVPTTVVGRADAAAAWLEPATKLVVDLSA